MAKSLYLIDAYGLIYRSYYAFMRNPMYNQQGFNTSTVFGFSLTIEELIRKRNPNYIAIVFDPPGGTFRNDIYPLYKANRDETPEEIKKSIPLIKRFVEALNIPSIEVLGYEADDVIGTLAHKAAAEDFEVYMMTSDKDYAQLVNEKIFMYKPKKSGTEAEVLGIEEVKVNYGVQNPLQFIDILALMGDASDNIPGAPGIGEKTAQKLILEYGSLDAIYEKVDKLSEKIRNSLVNNREQVLLSKKLATICIDVPVDFEAEKFLKREYNAQALRELFMELNFKNILSRFIPGEAAAKPVNKPVQQSLFDMPVAQVEQEPEMIYKTINDVNTVYAIVDDEPKLEALVHELEKKTSFCFDTETTGLDVHSDDLIGISISFKSGTGFYIVVKPEMNEAIKQLEPLRKVFADEKIEKIGHNIKFDMLMLYRYQVEVKGKLFDTMLAHYLLHPEKSHKMDDLALQFLQYKPIAITELIGEKGKMQRNMKQVSLENLSQYAIEDADITFQLSEILKPELERMGLAQLYYDMEAPMIPVLASIERAGFTLNKNILMQYAGELREKIIGLEQEIFKIAGYEFNIASPKQMGELLFDKLKIIDNAKKTKTQQYSTNEETLLLLRDKHSIIDIILNYRGLKKLLSTYVESLPELIHPLTGKIHTSFNQMVTTTGRLSSSNPNLQNIPIRDEEGLQIRRAFTSSNENYVLLSADYSQIELRVMAHASKDDNMLEAFRLNKDIHTATAAKIFNVPEIEVNKDMRRKAKTANFGIIYGISAYGLTQRLQISRAEANELIEGYFRTFPKVKEYMENSINQAKKTGYVETLFKRRRYLPDIFSANATVRGMAERNAINTPIQGTAADIIKLAMIKIFARMQNEKLQSQMILQVHDELVFDVKRNEIEIVKQLVKEEMERAVLLDVPLLVEMGTGNNWVEAH